LQTICGIGRLAAAQLIAQIGEIERFGHPGALVSLAGLAVKQRESGSSVRGRAQMDRHGRSSLRHLLYMCALVAMRWDPQMRAWAQRLKARGKPSKVVLGAVMRKLLHIIYGVWKHASDYDAQLAFPASASGMRAESWNALCRRLDQFFLLKSQKQAVFWPKPWCAFFRPCQWRRVQRAKRP
jgi:transposase